ncbi:MAG TPA: amidohydrolase [Bryobacteraceae bacterium]|nr:amidohydrolase [Bryobacteraceae bacterium]
MRTFLLAAVLGLPAFCASDTILVRGHIFTGNARQKWAQAVAITGSRIDVVGSDAEVLKLKGGKTKVIDLEGRTVIPGIVDSHTHMWFGALALHGFNLATPELWVDPKAEASAFAAKVKEYAASHPKDRVLFGRAVFANDVTHDLLDAASPDRPVVIHAATEHTYWVNQKAIEMAKITTAPVTDPDIEKFIVRDANRRPTGVFRESSMQLIERALPPQPTAEKVQWMREAALYLNRYGITSVTNATGSLEEIQIYAAMRDQHQLTVRTKTAFGSVAVKHKLTPEFLAQLDQARTAYHDDWVSANLVKFFADGAGGPPMYEPAELQSIYSELDKRGYQIMTHAIGAGPAKMALDAYEAVEKTNGSRDRRFRIEHGINIAATDVARFPKLGVSVSMQPAFCCFADGPGGGTNSYRSFEDNGTNLAFGSDWPCSWPPDPLESIQQSVTRALRVLFTKPSTGAEVKYVTPEQRITVEQAVMAYTRGGAYERFSEDKIGTLEKGKEADLVVLSQDIFAAQPQSIGAARVRMTMVGGKTVYQADK